MLKLRLSIHWNTWILAPKNFKSSFIWAPRGAFHLAIFCVLAVLVNQKVLYSCEIFLSCIYFVENLDKGLKGKKSNRISYLEYYFHLRCGVMYIIFLKLLTIFKRIPMLACPACNEILIFSGTSTLPHSLLPSPPPPHPCINSALGQLVGGRLCRLFPSRYWPCIIPEAGPCSAKAWGLKHQPSFTPGSVAAVWCTVLASMLCEVPAAPYTSLQPTAPLWLCSAFHLLHPSSFSLLHSYLPSPGSRGNSDGHQWKVVESFSWKKCVNKLFNSFLCSHFYLSYFRILIRWLRW